MSRFIVNVLDSFGVGEMADVSKVRPQDVNANTAVHIIERMKDISIPTLEKLGLMNAIGYQVGRHKFNEKANFGVANLGHIGADSFLGHQEIAGTTPVPPLNQPFNETIAEVEKALLKKGYRTRRVGNKNEPKILVVNEVATVGDNLETDLGQVFNVSGLLDELSFKELKEIGQTVRNVVKVSRVITFGGKEITLENLLNARRVSGQFAGVDAPLSGIYNQGYQVVHLGYGIDPEVQVPTILDREGIYISLIGKTADIIQSDHADRYSGVDTEALYNRLLEDVKTHESGFFFINIQETDLAGHAENVERYADRLELSDKKLAELISILDKDDILIVMADHGNDPTIGHSQHTREKVPLLIYKKGLQGKMVGERETMSDVGQTVSDYFKVAKTQNGKSFLADLNI